MRLPSSVASLLLLLTACAGDDPDGAGDDTGPAGDSGDTGDTGAPPAGELTFNLGGRFTGTTFTLTWLDVTTLGTEAVTFGDAWVSQPADTNPLPVSPGAPPTEHLQPLDPAVFPGVTQAWYVPALHVDLDPDGVLSDEEAYVGAGVWWVVYVDNPQGTDITPTGLVAGWNVVNVLGDTPATGDPAAIPLAATLAATDPYVIGGTFIDPETRPLRFAVVPMAALAPDSDHAPFHDAPLAPTWTAELSGNPPQAHTAVVPRYGLQGAQEVPVAYDDVDASGGWTAGDVPVYTACISTTPVGMLWLPPVDDLFRAAQMAYDGVASGWTAVTVGPEGGQGLDASARTMLAITPDCPFGGAPPA